ncbi:DUF4760 domain-containing protein [Neisseria shayeganii]|uniref:Uncharacterized protein n=1 Tax=Neisseria shayeganii 871 TaxID=1032488 RepID=G4CGB3_9NEIS|nr:DUF4760 domain-containing protein [Neisseria shayeganii]EGY53161.1 hypothetical protein HMPREF9371_0652 [Neisseria shayeganii 871]
MPYRHLRKRTAPGIWLGVVFVALFILYLFLISIRLHPNLSDINWFWVVRPAGVKLSIWLGVITTAFLPTMGWLWSSFVAIRNHVKQHSMNILLETRTSAVYMENAKKINEVLRCPEKSLADVRVEISYILNFLEFVAIGIRQNDIDEHIFYQAWRGFLNNVIKRFRPVIDEVQVSRPSVWENLLWLNNRWQTFGKVPMDGFDRLALIVKSILVVIVLIAFSAAAVAALALFKMWLF